MNSFAMSSQIVICLTLISLTFVSSECTGFKPGSEQHVSVSYREQFRRGVVRKDVNVAEISWKPQEMLSDLTCYQIEDSALLYKTANDVEYTTADVDLRSAGEAAKWYLDVKPCLAYKFAIKVSGQSEEIFELPDTLGPASAEEISSSNYVPEPPTGFNPTVGANMASISWDKSDCANSYYITYKVAGSEEEAKFINTDGETTEAQLQDLKACTNYEVIINAYLNDNSIESGELVANLATKPRLDAAKGLEVKLTRTTMNSAVVELDVWSVPCIEEYEITICDGEGQCKPAAVVPRTPGVPTIAYTAEDLESCTDYTLEIQPFYPETALEKKVLNFRTPSPDASSLEVGQVMAEAVTSGSVQLTWPSVKCAVKYVIYQKETQDYEWKKVADTQEQEIVIGNVTPCTEFHFAVAAELDDRETAKSESSPVMSTLEESEPFEAPNLEILNADRSAELSWDHAECIESYLLKFCIGQFDECQEQTVSPQGEKRISAKLENLQPCTQYSLEVVPIIPGKKFIARTNDFTTTNGTPQAPNGFKAQLIEGKRAQLAWDNVQCSTGFRVYHKTSDPESYETAKTTQDAADTYNDPIPCTTYFYAVSTLVGEQESEKTEWQNLLIPPRTEAVPIIKVLSNENDTMTLKIEPSEINSKCEPSEYELSYSKNGGNPFESKLVLPDDIGDNGEIKLSFESASSSYSIVQAKIKYAGSDSWTGVASTREPGERSRISQVPSGASNSATLVPILVGIVIGLIIIVLVIVFVVKRRKNRSNYDAEKADNNGKAGQEETQKLNENHPDA